MTQTRPAAKATSATTHANEVVLVLAKETPNNVAYEAAPGTGVLGKLYFAKDHPAVAGQTPWPAKLTLPIEV